MDNKKLLEFLKTSSISERLIKYREAIIAIKLDNLNIDDIEIIINIYKQLKDIYLRKTLLKKMYDLNIPELKQFFEEIYKKERYLDMRLYAIRGLAKFIDENQINKIMDNFLSILIKRAKTTPYNYQEYELLRAVNGLPYLIEKYKYPCFNKAYDQLEKQYNAMPDAFKGHFTLDKNGDPIQLRKPEETKKMIESFVSKTRNEQ